MHADKANGPARAALPPDRTGDYLCDKPSINRLVIVCAAEKR
jgi:hypothetical protein